MLLSGTFIFAQRGREGQRPERRDGDGDNRMPRRDDDRFPRIGDRDSEPRFRQENRPDFFNNLDSTKSGKIEAEEFQSAADNFFNGHDKNQNGILEENELRRERGDSPPSPDELPPFLFLEFGDFNLSRSAFDERIRQRFEFIDTNHDGVIDRKELEKIKPLRDKKHDEGRRSSPKNAEFLGAEMRFGDKLITNAPFSAEILIENSRRLFDGSVVTTQSKGAIYRDGAGRTRRERSLENIGGFSFDEPKNFVVINDFPAKINYFIDLNRKTVRQNPLRNNEPPKPDFEPSEGKNESLGTKILEGVKVEGTRTTFEIPVGQIGNAKPIPVVTEKWFSPELQLIVMSKHTDPLAGEQIFRLVNVKIGEPAANLFTSPKDFKIEK